MSEEEFSENISEKLESIKRLTRDLVDAAAILSPHEARYLVDTYYQLQDYRKAAGNQTRALNAAGEPIALISWLWDQMEMLEKQIARPLDRWSGSQPLGQWARSVHGIGPVIGAGLLAHIDMAKAAT